MSKCGIYGFFQISSGKWYVGQSIDIERREKEHRSCIDSDWHQFLLKNPNDFVFTILEECKEEELDSREAYYINLYNSYEQGFNSTRGNHTEESQQEKTNTGILITEWRGSTITDEDECHILRAIQTKTFLNTVEKILLKRQIIYEKIKYDLTWKFDENHFLIHAWPINNNCCKRDDKVSIYLNLENNITRQHDIELENIIKKDKIEWEDKYNDLGIYYRWYYIARKGNGYTCNKTFQVNKEHFLISDIKYEFNKPLEILHEQAQLQRIDCDPYFII